MIPDGAPDGRCGFVLEPEDVPEDGAAEYETGSDVWYRASRAACCWREVWDGGDGERCIWHAETDDKSADELVAARADGPERLDGASVPAVELDDVIDFEECGLWAANFDGTGLREVSFEGVTGWYVQFPDASLGAAQFPDAYLSDAQFPDADLLHAQFPDANLRATNFTDAHLEAVDLTGTDLFDAALQGTFLYGATFEDASINRDTTFGAHYVPAPPHCRRWSARASTSAPSRSRPSGPATSSPWGGPKPSPPSSHSSARC